MVLRKRTASCQRMKLDYLYLTHTHTPLSFHLSLFLKIHLLKILDLLTCRVFQFWILLTHSVVDHVPLCPVFPMDWKLGLIRLRFKFLAKLHRCFHQELHGYLSLCNINSFSVQGMGVIFKKVIIIPWFATCWHLCLDGTASFRPLEYSQGLEFLSGIQTFKAVTAPLAWGERGVCTGLFGGSSPQLWSKQPHGGHWGLEQALGCTQSLTNALSMDRTSSWSAKTQPKDPITLKATPSLSAATGCSLTSHSWLQGQNSDDFSFFPLKH